MDSGGRGRELAAETTMTRSAPMPVAKEELVAMDAAPSKSSVGGYDFEDSERDLRVWDMLIIRQNRI